MKAEWLGLLRGMTIGSVMAMLLTLTCSSGCASTPRHEAKRFAVVQKTTVDGLGKAFLNYCEIVREPRCRAQDAAAADEGTSWDEPQRIACLRPCDSATVTKIQSGIDVVRTAQAGLFELIRDPSASEEEIKAQREQLARAAEQLIALLEATGATEALGRAIGGL